MVYVTCDGNCCSFFTKYYNIHSYVNFLLFNLIVLNNYLATYSHSVAEVVMLYMTSC